MPQQLPLVPSQARYRFSTVLDGTPYAIDARWNSREGAWYMDLLAEDETPIRNNMKLVLGTLPGTRSASEDFPTGAFIVTDLSRSNVDASFDDMGVRVQVWYLTAEELDEATSSGVGSSSAGSDVLFPEFPPELDF